MKNAINIPPLGMCYQDRIFHSIPTPFYNSTLFKVVREDSAPKSTIEGKKLFDLGKWYDCVIRVSLRYGDNTIDDIEAVIDTGAYSSNINREVLYKLGCIKPDGFACQRTYMDGAIQTPSFIIDMSIPGFNGIVTDSFVEMPCQIDYPVLLGTKFLKLCDLHFFGKRGQFEIEF